MTQHESKLTHLDPQGQARIVDIGEKAVSRRQGIAAGRVQMTAETLSAVKHATIRKGDVLSVARISGIMAAKETSRLIPLCHPIRLDHIEIEFEFESAPHVGSHAIVVRALATATDRTGVEMEALTAVSVACLTIYDMCKALDRGMVIGEIRVLQKTGGQGGDYVAG